MGNSDGVSVNHASHCGTGVGLSAVLIAGTATSIVIQNSG